MEAVMLNITYKNRRTNAWNLVVDINQVVLGSANQRLQRWPLELTVRGMLPLGENASRKGAHEDQAGGGDTTWANTGGTRSGKGQSMKG